MMAPWAWNEVVSCVILVVALFVIVWSSRHADRIGQPTDISAPSPGDRLASSEAPPSDAPPQQWLDFMAAHAGTRDDWHQMAGRAYRKKWGIG